MFVRQWTCTYRIKAQREFLGGYGEIGNQVEARLGAQCLGTLVGVEGRVNELVRLLGFESREEAATFDAKLHADPEWSSFRQNCARSHAVLYEDIRILEPTSFSPEPVAPNKKHGLVDVRTYTIRPGEVQAFVDYYAEKGWPLQRDYLGDCLGWYKPAVGPMDRVVHFWAYTNQSVREGRRNNLYTDQKWIDYISGMAAQDHMIAAENKFMRPLISS